MVKTTRQNKKLKFFFNSFLFLSSFFFLQSLLTFSTTLTSKCGIIHFQNEGETQAVKFLYLLESGFRKLNLPTQQIWHRACTLVKGTFTLVVEHKEREKRNQWTDCIFNTQNEKDSNAVLSGLFLHSAGTTGNLQL